jgi:hypothetical protein
MLLAGGRPIIFEFDVPLELSDRRIVELNRFAGGKGLLWFEVFW